MDYKYDVKKGLKSINSQLKGLHWLYVNGKHDLSIICHSGSYGRQQGKFEVYPSWEKDVIGYLTFGEVQKYIDKLMRFK